MPIKTGAGTRIPSFPLEIDVKPFLLNANAFRDSIFRMAKQMGNMTVPLTESVNKVVIPSMLRNFAVGGRPPWPELSQSRIDARLSKGGASLRILIDSEKLARAATSRPIWRITPTQADMEALDNLVPYAKFHQSGTKNMPQREFALLQEIDVDKIVEVFDKWIESMTNQRDFWPYHQTGF